MQPKKGEYRLKMPDMKAQGLNPLEQVPTTFIFKGRPG